MRRTCERPGCGEPVAVVYGQEDDQQFWVDAWSPDRAADVPPAGARGVLCAAHGEVLVPPRGWTLVDRRDVVPRLFKPRLVVAGSDESAALKRPVPAPSTGSESTVPTVDRGTDDTGSVRKRAPRSASSRRRISDVPRPQLFGEIERETDPLGDAPEPSGSLLRDAFRRAGTMKREAAHELLRSTSVAPTADSDQR